VVRIVCDLSTVVKAGWDQLLVLDWRHAFESIGQQVFRLQQKRRFLEAGIGPDFDLARSCQLDALVYEEERILEEPTTERSSA
jgi:hypothetical protein